MNISLARISRQSMIALTSLLLAVSQPLAETVCTKLFDQLDEVEAQANGEDTAAELEDARALYDDMSCPDVPTGEGCPELATRINRLQTAGAGRASPGREKQRLMAALTRAGCFRDRPESPSEAWGPEAEEPGSETMDELYREGGREDDAWDGTAPPQPRGADGGGGMSPAVAGGRYTTLCVRSCDGFYYPISNSAGPAAFAADAEACKAACPNQDVALYYVRPGAPKEQALSASGNEAYTSLANALHYRSKYEKSCQCAVPQVADLPAGADSKAVEAVQERLKTKPVVEDEMEAAPVEEESETIRSAPVVIDPSVRDLNEETPSAPNGLRGVSPSRR